MDNDILRVENFKEEELNSSHFKNSVEENKSKSAKNSIASFIRDEKNNKAKDSEALTEKPKLINSLFLAVAFIAFDTVLALCCFLTKEIYFAIACAVLTSVTLPFSLTYFFRALDTRSNFSTLSIFIMFICGAIAFYALEIIFTKAIDLIFRTNNLVVLSRCLLDMTLIALITMLFYKKSKKEGSIALMVIACAVASGFCTFKSITTTFESLFIKVQIFDGQSLSVGAIINTGNWATRSLTQLFKGLFYNGFYKPLIFTALSVVIGYSLSFYLNKTERGKHNRTSNLLIIITCMLINALISVSTSILFFEIIYNICAVLFAGYMFYDVLDYSIKHEKYKD